VVYTISLKKNVFQAEQGLADPTKYIYSW